MSDDEDELAALRAARDARSAGGGSARDRLAGVQTSGPRPSTDTRKYFDTKDAAPKPSFGPPRPPAEGGNASDDDEDEDAPTMVEPDTAEIFTDDLRSQFPMAFGEQEKKPSTLLKTAHAANKRSFGPPRPPGVGPPRPPDSAAAEPSGTTAEGGDAGPDIGPPRPDAGADDSDSDDEDEEEDPYNLPISHEVQLKGHTKMVSAMAVDHKGARAITGSLDYTVQMWDFNGMKSDMRAFRKMEPSEGHPVMALSYSPSGDAFLVVTGSACPKVYDRDGRELGEFPRGDMYIRDQKNTKGHVSGCTGGAWHPNERNTALTSSEDGSLRLWDCEAMVQKTVIKPQLYKPGKFGSSASIGLVPVPRQQLIAKQTWNYVSRPNHVMHKAHEPSTDITSLSFSQDGSMLITRGGDETMKVWDIRKLKQPVKVFEDLTTTHSNTMCGFSPDERLILTGVCAPKEGEDGGLVMFDRQKLEFVRRIGVPGSVCAFNWHTQLNQILIGAGGRKAGATHMLYHPTFSEKGALRCVGRAPRKAMPFDFAVPLAIHNPHALPMFKEERGRKRQRDADRADPVKSKMPDTSGISSGPGRGGKLGCTGGTLLTQHLLKQAGNKRPSEQMDTRESILRHEELAKSDPKWFGSAYEESQPKAIYAEVSDDEEGGK